MIVDGNTVLVIPKELESIYTFNGNPVKLPVKEVEIVCSRSAARISRLPRYIVFKTRDIQHQCSGLSCHFRRPFAVQREAVRRK